MSFIAEQLVTDVPEFMPLHHQVQKPAEAVTTVAFPALQRFSEGIVDVGIPFAVQHDPLITQVVTEAEQVVVVVPPFEPVHPHVQGPLPVTELGVPMEQRKVLHEGAEVRVVPFADPHDQETGLEVVSVRTFTVLTALRASKSI